MTTSLSAPAAPRPTAPFEIAPESRVGEIAARFPLTTRVLARHGIDFCCGGGRPLAEACAARGVDAAAVAEEMRRLIATTPDHDGRWLDADPDALVRHIVADFHEPLREELPRLESMARKVARVHAERDPQGRLPEILATLLAFQEELRDHMRREEDELFPRLAAGGAPRDLEVYVDDHERAGEALARLRALTDGYVPPADACNTWRALWAGLEALEATMHEHVHLENNVLFARTAGGGPRESSHV